MENFEASRGKNANFLREYDGQNVSAFESRDTKEDESATCSSLSALSLIFASHSSSVYEVSKRGKNVQLEIMNLETR